MRKFDFSRKATPFLKGEKRMKGFNSLKESEYFSQTRIHESVIFYDFSNKRGENASIKIWNKNTRLEWMLIKNDNGNKIYHFSHDDNKEKVSTWFLTLIEKAQNEVEKRERIRNLFIRKA